MKPYRGLTKEGKLVKGWYCKNPYTKNDIIIGIDDFFPYEVIPETVGQQIGIKDKNGKEIYEGDIFDDCWVVRFFDAHYLLCNPMDEPAIQCAKEVLDSNIAAHTEIIGYIHGNPELLKCSR